jgi:hypothetical protein
MMLTTRVGIVHDRYIGGCTRRAKEHPMTHIHHTLETKT